MLSRLEPGRALAGRARCPPPRAGPSLGQAVIGLPAAARTNQRGLGPPATPSASARRSAQLRPTGEAGARRSASHVAAAGDPRGGGAAGPAAGPAPDTRRRRHLPPRTTGGGLV